MTNRIWDQDMLFHTPISGSSASFVNEALPERDVEGIILGRAENCFNGNWTVTRADRSRSHLTLSTPQLSVLRNLL